MNIVLLNPEIPYNTGNIARTCVLTNSTLHLIKPFGFILDDKRIKRAGLDYWKFLKLKIWECKEEFFEKNSKNNIYFATTKTKQRYSDISFNKSDFIMFGPESRGIPEEILNKNKKNCITIPIIENGRSLNLSNASAIILFEAYRQNSFEF